MYRRQLEQQAALAAERRQREKALSEAEERMFAPDSLRHLRLAPPAWRGPGTKPSFEAAETQESIGVHRRRVEIINLASRIMGKLVKHEWAASFMRRWSDADGARYAEYPQARHQKATLGDVHAKFVAQLPASQNAADLAKGVKSRTAAPVKDA